MKINSFFSTFIKYLVFSVVVASLAFGGLAFGQGPGSGERVSPSTPEKTESLFRRVWNRILDFVLGKKIFLDLTLVTQAKKAVEQGQKAAEEGNNDGARASLAEVRNVLAELGQNRETEKLEEAVEAVVSALASGDDAKKSFDEAIKGFITTIAVQVEKQNEALAEINDIRKKAEDASQKVNLAVADYQVAQNQLARDSEDVPVEPTESSEDEEDGVLELTIVLKPVQDSKEVEAAVDEYNNIAEARPGRVAQAYIEQVLQSDQRVLFTKIDSPKANVSSDEYVKAIGRNVEKTTQKLQSLREEVYGQDRIAQAVAAIEQITTKLIRPYTLVNKFVSTFLDFVNLQRILNELRITTATDQKEEVVINIFVLTKNGEQFKGETKAEVKPGEARPAEARVPEDQKLLFKDGGTATLTISENGGFVEQQKDGFGESKATVTVLPHTPMCAGRESSWLVGHVYPFGEREVAGLRYGVIVANSGAVPTREQLDEAARILCAVPNKKSIHVGGAILGDDLSTTPYLDTSERCVYVEGSANFIKSDPEFPNITYPYRKPNFPILSTPEATYTALRWVNKFTALCDP